MTKNNEQLVKEPIQKDNDQQSREKTWGDWFLSEGWNTFKAYAIIHTINERVVKPAIKTGEQILGYMETDDPELPEEKEAFDLIQNQLMLAHLALNMAKEQKINRRGLAVRFFSSELEDNLSPQERNIIFESTKKVDEFISSINKKSPS